jgi:hypothetical protein
MQTADLEAIVADGCAALERLVEEAGQGDVVAAAAAMMTQIATGVLHDRLEAAGQHDEALAVVAAFGGSS